MSRATTSVTLDGTVSFYVPSSKPKLLEACAQAAGSVVVRGPDGPRVVARMRAAGWSGVAIFDGAAYEPNRTVDAQEWLDLQFAAGADRLLSPGVWVPWTNDILALEQALEQEAQRVASAPGTTLLVALDRRWLSNGSQAAIKALKGAGPAALILSDRGDPLAKMGSVNNLIAITTQVPDVSLLRGDHGVIGGVAFRAVHGSIGLRPVHRHFVPPEATASAIPNDRTPRVFVLDLMDWFAGGTIAGWATTRVRLRCDLDCCGGQTLERFLDERLADEAASHNVRVLSELARRVVDAPADMRRRLFGQLCAAALDRYGSMGKVTSVISPKPQLLQWAQFA